VWITLFHSFGGQYFDPAGKPLLDSPASIAAFRFMVENLGKISPPGNLTWDFLPRCWRACRPRRPRKAHVGRRCRPLRSLEVEDRAVISATRRRPR
jgi:hypothetical protein